MSTAAWSIFTAVVLLLSWISAEFHKKNGYFYWRTFILACMGFAGIGLLMLQIFFN